jgi:hypothetical protein
VLLAGISFHVVLDQGTDISGALGAAVAAHQRGWWKTHASFLCTPGRLDSLQRDEGLADRRVIHRVTLSPGLSRSERHGERREGYILCD